MKAIILAGGEGTRLRPLSICKPKPMIRLFDRPLLEHIVILLRQCGFTELCMTLHYLPNVIKEYFGDGSGFGVSIEYRTEAEAAGTAGSVRDCADFIEEDDFLVISGDAACSYDLRAMMEKHRISGADATILVSQREEPSEFGLVLADESGCIHGFVEKPGQEKVVSDLVNTGIYVLSPSVLKEIPKGRSVDFGGELFPRMLRGSRRLRTWQAEGYWNDVGSCEAYLETCRDALDGRFPLELSVGRRADFGGLCWVSPEAHVASKVNLGPYTVIGGGSTVEDGCRISGSVLDGALVQAQCMLEDSILSRGVLLGREVHVMSGCVLAEGVTVGDGALIRNNLRFWPGLALPGGGVIAESLMSSAQTHPLRFQASAAISGENHGELTPERFFRLGRGSGGSRAGAAAAGGSYARLLASSFLLGAGAEGKRTFLMDAALPSAAAAMAGVYDLDLCAFFQQEGGRTVVRFFDRDGLPLPRKEQRRLLSALSLPSEAASPDRCFALSLLSGTEEAYLSELRRACPELGGVRLSCTPGPLRSALLRCGAEVCPQTEGLPELYLSEDGFTLSAKDESGRVWSWDMLLCALTAAELRCGAQEVVLPYDAPLLAEQIALEENGTVYRLERDGEDARRLWRSAPWCKDGSMLALRLLWRIQALGNGPSLEKFMGTLPEYHVVDEVLRISGPDAAILRGLSRKSGAETVNGVRLRQGAAAATIRRSGLGELRILAESCNMEAAAELCDTLRRQILTLDGAGRA